MPLRTDRFLDLLEERGILSPNDVDWLRQQAAEMDPPVHPVFVARRLVKTGYLNPYYAKTLLSELASVAEDQPETAESSGGGGSAGDLSNAAQLDDTLYTLDDLGLAPIETQDLFSDADEAVPMMPGLPRGNRWADWMPWGRGRGRQPLNLEGPGYERWVLPAVFALAAVLLVWLGWLILRVVWG
ncbi:MAG: hypothetical protein GTO03_01095 [Planctomycetales bacterium]|nr:hypothetical protein [Planctomycetales bacterium]